MFDTMKPYQVLTGSLTGGFIPIGRWTISNNHHRGRTVCELRISGLLKFPVSMKTIMSRLVESSSNSRPLGYSPVPVMASDIGTDLIQESPGRMQAYEEDVEKVIYRFRFLALLGVLGSLMGSLLCFVKGCTYVVAAFRDYFASYTNVILVLVEAIDVYLLGTVMLVFGMGLYELFVSTLDIANSLPDGTPSNKSNLFGLFTIKVSRKALGLQILYA
ncbi:hypothetical protein GIB67_038747 [Kingdonia uniflora]|uniref:Uncharacterized protein n=1 Tax=Kingdonia uniflora TaxID=39325 RepID=A0A7J7NTA4_9MAGN|nr:hypothetical protein GIB67_038747 [Kingdonia uniflora]